MEKFQQRVIDEKQELDQKKEALHTFLGGDVVDNLPQDEQERLVMQWSYMVAYSNILAARIECFK